jgi:hypothetical protein
VTSTGNGEREQSQPISSWEKNNQVSACISKNMAVPKEENGEGSKLK